MSNLTMSPVMQKQSVQSNQSTTVKPKPLDSKQAKELANTYRDQGKYNVADSLERATLRSGLSTVPTPDGDVQVNSLSDGDRLLGGGKTEAIGYMRDATSAQTKGEKIMFYELAMAEVSQNDAIYRTAQEKINELSQCQRQYGNNDRQDNKRDGYYDGFHEHNQNRYSGQNNQRDGYQGGDHTHNN